MRERPKKHRLGFGNGSILEYEDGTAGYVPSMAVTQTFRVKISDVTGFSVTKGKKMLERQLNVLGNGTLLGTANVPHGTAQVIERWFREHPDFAKNAPMTHMQATSSDDRSSLADEIERLGRLRDQGILTEDEFTAAKQRLIGG